MGIGKFGFDALHYGFDARDISDILSRCRASAAGDNAADTSAAISDDGVGVTWGGEGTRLVVKREDGSLHGVIGSAVFIVVTGTRADVVGTADGQAGGIAVLEHNKAGVTALVQCGRVTHLLVRDDTLEP